MSKLVIETYGFHDWQSRLADPMKHWKRERSAYELAVSWERAAAIRADFPPEILGLLGQEPALRHPELLVGIVEHKVPLKFGNTASQNDIWALVKVGSAKLSLAIEGKAGEDFDKLVSEWLEEKKRDSNKPARLGSLLQLLGIPDMNVSDVRYQLLHRTASALIEAERFGADYAAMIVQSFTEKDEKSTPDSQLADFVHFAKKLGANAGDGLLAKVPDRNGIPLFLGWATCKTATDKEVAALTWSGGSKELIRESNLHAKS